jgi:outer membrane protein OmpA-like peptidoglycan-associated protein
MPKSACIAQSAARRMTSVAVGALAIAAVAVAVQPARAQSAYVPLSHSVTLDLSVLDQLGPAPRVPDGRFVLRVPKSPAEQRIASHRHPTHPRQAAKAMAQVEHFGSVTIDYSALPAPVSQPEQRIVLRRPGTHVTHVAAADQPAARAPAASSKPLLKPPAAAPSGIVVLRRPAPQSAPMPSPPQTPRPQVAALSPADFERITPAAGSSDEPLPQPLLGGTALAATRSPAAPIVDPAVSAPRSDSGTVRFAPGVAELQGDATVVLDSLAQKLRTSPQERIQLVAYASGNKDQAIEARRISLARAVAVRAYLIQRGVSSTQIDVRALGNRVKDGGSADRVDLVALGR